MTKRLKTTIIGWYRKCLLKREWESQKEETLVLKQEWALEWEQSKNGNKNKNKEERQENQTENENKSANENDNENKG